MLTEVFSLLIRPQYYDFDPSSIVHNATYVRWLEDGRIAFQQASPWPAERLYAADNGGGLDPHRNLLQAPGALGREPCCSKCGSLSAGRSALSLALRFVHPETQTEYARAEQSGCFVRRSTGKSDGNAGGVFGVLPSLTKPSSVCWDRGKRVEAEDARDVKTHGEVRRDGVNSLARR